MLPRRLDGEATTKGGIIIPDTAKEEAAGGRGRRRRPRRPGDHGTPTPLDVKAGDRVKVVRTALQDAASVAGLLVTTEALVADRPTDKPALPVPAVPDF